MVFGSSSEGVNRRIPLGLQDQSGQERDFLDSWAGTPSDVSPQHLYPDATSVVFESDSPELPILPLLPPTPRTEAPDDEPQYDDSWDGRSAARIPVSSYNVGGAVEDTSRTDPMLSVSPELRAAAQPAERPVLTGEVQAMVGDASRGAFNPRERMTHLPPLVEGTPAPSHGEPWVQSVQGSVSGHGDTEKSAGEPAPVAEEVDADAAAPFDIEPAVVVDGLGNRRSPGSGQTDDTSTGAQAPHIIEDNSGVERLSPSKRIQLANSLRGLSNRYLRYLLDPTETRPMKQAPYAIIGAQAVALSMDFGDMPVLSAVDQWVNSGSGVSFSAGALLASTLFILSEMRNYPDKPLEVPVSARAIDSLKRNIRHPFGARRVRAERREELQQVRAEEKAAAETLLSWAQRSTDPR